MRLIGTQPVTAALHPAICLGMNADEHTPAHLDWADDSGELLERLKNGHLTNDEPRRLGARYSHSRVVLSMN